MTSEGIRFFEVVETLCRQIAKRGRVKFVGIGADARKLRVNRVHLYLVLSGKRTSHRLLARYNQLKGMTR